MPAELETRRFAAERRAMVEVQLRPRGLRDERVLEAMARVPRHAFVEPSLWPQAYEDHPLPIAEGQTVSQPYIVALILEAMALDSSSVVLEVGTGSGYMTALLAELAHWTYSLERHEALARQAEAVLQQLGYNNVSIMVRDGSEGLPGHAPFDAIAVSAAAPSIPRPLFEQLREGGRLVVPVGPPQAQELQLVRKHQGQPIMMSLGACAFVPLIGSRGYVSG
ncbi:MAG TPA: protein-L-isoaspartate(D-aspartate) O-methyltransferase [Terriglobales bacterium]|nr:protein-L-isoaspartate(D-aspartate) O-methyltransferase [Terriglobales bacterium]